MKIFSPSLSTLLLSATLTAGSASLAPSDTPTPLCSDDVLVLEVNVKTDFFPDQNEWILEKQDDENQDDWAEVASNPLEESTTEYQDRLCLEPGSTYRWTITDTIGDGLFVLDPISLFVDEVQIFQENYNRWLSLEVVFVTPSDPSGSVEVLTASPSSSPTNGPSASFMPSSTPTESSAPSSGPTVFECDDGLDLLAIDVFTDRFPWQSSWVLDEKDPSSSTYFQIASNNLPFSYKSYEDKFCLEQGVSYRWTLTDEREYGRPGNGFNCDADIPCGYSVSLNGEEIVSNGKFFDEVVKEIGPVDCEEETGLHRVVNPRPGQNNVKEVYCSTLQRLIRNTGSNEGCFAPLIDGSGYLYDKCKKSCGKVGAGPCA